jgi:lycopene cyclase domain-containing protein
VSRHYLYLALDLLTLFFPLIFSFYSKANFSKKWKFLVPAIAIPGVLFLAADEVFTRAGIWGFNPAYLTGFYIGSLPLEEVLFFICIPYACVFTYEAFNVLVEKDYLRPYQQAISAVVIVFSLAIAITHITEMYTVTTFLALAVFLIFLHVTRKDFFLGRFYFAYGVILVPFFIVNGVLTGSGLEEPVVWYNDAETLGLRMATIPVEDMFYAMLLMVMNVGIFEWAQRGKRPTALH